MKNLILMLVMACSCSFLFSNLPILQHDPTVIAFSGLKLRAEPNVSGKLLKVIPFGQKVETLDTLEETYTIEWIQGNWTKVKYEGKTGYVFDGFLSPLPIPVNDYELSQSDADISYPLLAWAEKNFKSIAVNDTIESKSHDKLIQYLETGIILTRKENKYAFEVGIDIPNIRLGDAYNLCRALLLTQTERELFEENTLFITNSDNIVDRVKIDIDAPIEIRRTGDGVSITVRSYQYICGL